MAIIPVSSFIKFYSQCVFGMQFCLVAKAKTLHPCALIKKVSRLNNTLPNSLKNTLQKHIIHIIKSDRNKSIKHHLTESY